MKQKGLKIAAIVVALAVLVFVLVFWFLSREAEERSVIEAPIAVMPTEPPAVLPEREPFYTYTVKKGDWLSCLSPDRWKEIYEKNQEIISDPNLIFPGQVLLIPSDITLETTQCGSTEAKPAPVRVKEISAQTVPEVVAPEGRVIGEQFIPYCNIGADPVNPNRVPTFDEREVVLTQDYFATMQTGSGKEVRCILKQGTVVVVDPSGRATWVRLCGNPILNEIFVAEAIPAEKKAEQEPVEEEGAQLSHTQPSAEEKPPDFIVLAVFEGTTPQERSASYVTDSSGNPVTDSTGNPVRQFSP